ncbi:hypothetical protein ACFL5U_03385 [Candidatus Margulisiibacteriota bacterium]
MTHHKKHSRLGFALAGTLLGGAALLGLGKLFPKMMERCKEMCEKMEAEGKEPPWCCKKMMEKYCSCSPEDKKPKRKRRRKS